MPSSRTFACSQLTIFQIRIVTDTHQDEKPNKKKKKHRGYAFVVYEREKDMRGKLDYIPTPNNTARLDLKYGFFCKDVALKLPIFSFIVSPFCSRYTKYEQHD